MIDMSTDKVLRSVKCREVAVVVLVPIGVLANQILPGKDEYQQQYKSATTGTY